MKKATVFFSLILLAVLKSQAQNTSPEAVQLSHKIAKKMKDSLELSAQQRQKVYEVNMSLHEQKQAVRQQSPADSLQPRIQRIERTRDSLYRPVLGEEKYQLYLQKKRRLINNN